MKKFISVLLFCITVFSLCVGCTNSFAEKSEIVSTPLKDESKRLLMLMEGFSENLQPGTAGSSLKAVKEAVRLMDWGMETKMTEEEISKAIETYFSEKDTEFVEEYTAKLEQLDETYQLLLTEGQEGLLDSAGCTDTAYPWGGEPMEAVEIFFKLMGFRDNSDK